MTDADREAHKLTALAAWQTAIAYAATQGQEPRWRPVEILDYFGRLVDKARATAEKASAKFPQPNYVTLKIAEEAGEVVRGAVHYAEGRMAWDEVEGEIVQLLAMLIRFVTEGDQINGISPPGFAASAWEPEVAPVTLIYRNYRGEVSERTITPKRIWFGSTDWHPDPQWLLTAFDHDKSADRDFALRDFGAAVPVVDHPTTTNTIVDHKSENIDHKPFRHGDSHIGTGHPESVAALSEESISLPVSIRSQPQTDLAEKARAFAVKWGKSDSFISTTEAIAAFATEYAAEAIEREKRKSIISIINLKALGKHFKARAEAAEQYLAQAIEAEREACAKVADRYSDIKNSERRNTRGGSEYLEGCSDGGVDISIAIRVRKGGENG